MSYFLPKNETVSFLTNGPFNRLSEEVETIYLAQSYFVPRLLDPEPGRHVAIFYCKTDYIARLRMMMTGYRPVKRVLPGKWIGVHP
ncbi:MAG: hypothetical protein ACOY3K_01570 [Candidatus Omnitrophota bacterium]